MESDGAVTYRQVRSPYNSLQVQAALRLGNIGSGQSLLLQATNSADMESLLERSAGVLSVSLAEAEANTSTDAQNTGSVTLSWAEAPNPYTGLDTLENLDTDSLGQAGQVVNLALITASRQYHY